MANMVLVLLDKDGVLCDNLPEGVISLSRFKPVPRLTEAFRVLNDDRFRIGVVTNQAYIALGQLPLEELQAMNHILTEKANDAGISTDHFTFKYCPHLRSDGCSCRKPKIGMIEQAVSSFKLDPAQTRFYAIGDKLVDLETLENYYEQILKPLGLTRDTIATILINWSHGEQRDDFRLQVKGAVHVKPDYEVSDLAQAFELVRAREEADK